MRKTVKTHYNVTKKGSAITRYMDVMVGQRAFGAMLYYELCIWLSVIPGAIGIYLRKIFWPGLFASCGKGVVFASNVILRHPNRIHLGNHVVISDGCILDARTDGNVDVLRIGDDVILSNNVMISCKSGTVEIGRGTGIGAQTIIQSTNNCPVLIGDEVIIGPRCYIVGGGNYNTDRFDIPICRQGIKSDDGVNINGDVWLGANVTVLGGVIIGNGSIAAAGAVVTGSMPNKAIYGGVPAKMIKMRG